MNRPWMGALACAGLLVLGDGTGRSAARAQDGLGPRPRRERVAAPSLEGGVAWLNTAEPLTWERLRGKVVLLDFWTFG